MLQKLLIGIDNDVEKNGVCLYYSKNTFELLNLTFFELFDKLDFLKDCENLDIEVFIEAGWLNLSNWHYNNNDSKAVIAKKGHSVGENHQVGKKIVEMCQYLGLKHHLIKPTKSKVDAETFKAITKYQGRTNSEMRDSCLLVWGR